MKTQITIAVHFALFILGIQTASACDICGSFIGITPYDNQSGISFLHRYLLYSKIDAPGQPVIPAGAYRLSPAYSVLHSAEDSATLQKGDFESYKIVELRGKWFIHQRVELNVLLPFVMVRSKADGITEKTAGPGDVTFWVGFHILRPGEGKVKHRLIAGGGIKLPLGSTSEKDADGTRLHLYLQPGTGSVDETAYIQYGIGAGKWGSVLNVTTRFNGENRYEEQVDPTLTGSLNFFRMMKKGNNVLLPQVQFYGEHCDGFTTAGVYAENSSINVLYAGVGCDAYFGKIGVHFSAQVPWAQERMENVPGATLRATAGISFNVNQTNYLIH